MNSNTFDKLSFLSLFLVIVLLPVFFLPFTNIPIETSKGLLLVIGLAVCIIFWGLARFFDGKIILPRSTCLLGGAGIVLVFLFSALFSDSSQVSFFGTMFDIGSFWFIFAGFLLMLMSSIILRNPINAKKVLIGAILSGTIVLIFQSLRLFLPEFLSLGVLVDKTDNVLGSWNALGIFAGFSCLMSLLVVEFFSTSKNGKLMFKALTILSLILVAVVNFSLVWELIGISALIIFVYKISINSRDKEAEGTEEKKTHFPVFSFVIIMIALLFIISGQFFRGILPDRLGIQNSEIGPSFTVTMLVAKSVLKTNPILGIGPNRFGEAWAMHKPIEINGTVFWGISFNSGSGLLPTFASTTGYLGILAWLVFFTLFIISGVKLIFSSIKNGENLVAMAFFIIALYLFISCFFYSVGAVLFLLALAFTGIFVGLSSYGRPNGEISISFLNDHRKSFFSIFFIIVLVIASAAISFKFVERLISASYFGKALTAPVIPEAEASIGRALTLFVNDLYLRTYAQIYLIKLSSLATKESDAESLTEADKADLQASLDQAVSGAQLATIYNPKNYLNFGALGSVYFSVASFGVKDAYSKAIESYSVASTLNPLNPGLKLAIANASFADGKIKEAKEYADAALSLKPDYIDALIVLSQIAKSEGDDKGAISYAERALSIVPANEDLIKYIDSLKNGNSPGTATPPSTDPITTHNSTEIEP